MKSNSEKVVSCVIEMSNVNIFSNTRERKFVELRALVCWIFREQLGMGWTHIALFFESKGKSMNHATVIHLVKMYPSYKNYNKELQKIEDCFDLKPNPKFDNVEQFYYLKIRGEHFEHKYNKLKEDIKKDKVIDVIRDIPNDKQDEIIERIKLWTKSWEWKSKDKCEIINASSGISESTY